MKSDTPPPELREYAYRLWRKHGQNCVETARKLKQEGYVLTGQAVNKWKNKYQWEARAARAEAEETIRINSLTDDAMLDVLLRQKQKYEEYLLSLPPDKVDTQATHALNGTLKMINEIRAVRFKPEIFSQYLRDLIEYLKDVEDFRGVQIIDNHLDGYSKYIKNKYLHE